MRKVIVLIVLAIANIYCAKAQIRVEEPEFSDQAVYLTSDSTCVPLPRENAQIKVKAAASVYLTSIGKIKSRITIKNRLSPLSIKQTPKLQIILKADNNNTDPKSFVNLFRFEQKESKRQAKIAEVGTFSGAEANSLKPIEYRAKKYGESSYFLEVEGLGIGQYGITIGDPDKLSNKNTLLITTFGITK